MSAALTVNALQERLAALGLYAGRIDGDFGPKSRAAFDAALGGSSKPRSRLSAANIAEAAKRLLLTPAHVGAVCEVESCGAGFDATTNKPVIRFEPHVFRDRTGQRFDGDHPDISHGYSQRTRYPQPAAQADRWNLFFRAVALNPEAALAATSYGLFQVMGFNFRDAGYPDLLSFVLGMATSESVQLMAFCQLIKGMGLVPALKRQDWAAYAERYNGPGYDDAPGRRDDYDVKLADAYKARGGK